MDENKLEAELQNKGLNAPRLTPDLIDQTIAGVDYHVFEGSCLTVCCLTLHNGYTVIGESACISPDNFDADIGRRIAHGKAREKIWGLEAYAIKGRASS